MNTIPKKFLFSRRIISQSTYLWYNTQVIPKESSNHTEQVDYIRSAIENKTFNWNEIKANALSKFGKVNNKNIDAVILKVIVAGKKFSAAQSFVTHLRNTKDELPLGVLNGLLHYYSEYSKLNPLSSEEKQYILKIYTQLYDKYKFLDYTTCERLIQALCAIDEWQKSIKVLDDIYVTSTPSHAAFSSIIATLFRNNKKADALKFIEKSLHNRRPLLNSAYEAWINYILRKYKDKKIKLKHLNDICVHLTNKCVVIPMETAEILKNTFISLDWNAEFSSIHQKSGKCLSCKETLSCLKLSDVEFNLLQKNVQDKLIVGKDLFLKTSPDELKRFLDFVKSTAPYDIVLDALNIAYAKGFSIKDKINALHFVIDYFRRNNKRILLLGRNHMLKWRPNLAQSLSKKVLTFFTDDSSQDDPYFITAAIMSGPQTDILSKDLLRNHQFLMKDDPLRKLFQRWQWQHQWMMFVHRGTPVIQSPLCYTPCAQQSVKGWHLPYERKDVESTGKLNTGLPDTLGWLCLLPKNVN